MREWQVRRRLGQDGLIVLADPCRIRGHLSDPRREARLIAIDRSRVLPRAVKRGLSRAVWELYRFDIDASRIETSRLEDSATHRLMADVWAHRGALEESETYQRIADVLRDTGVFRHKGYEIRRRDEVPAMMTACYLDLMQSLATDGYVADKSAEYATGGIGNAIVWHDGGLWHAAGATHRLAAARIVGLRVGFPLRIIGAHRGWLRDQGMAGLADIGRLPQVLQGVDGVTGR